MATAMSDEIEPQVLAKTLLLCDLPTIARCRCVSKQWRDIIDDAHFIKQVADISLNTNSTRLFFVELFGNLLHTAIGVIDTCRVPLVSQIMPVSLVGSCNGLLCLLSERTLDFCILNPTTLKHVCVPNLFTQNDNDGDDLSPNDDDDGCILFGFGYDFVSDDYKIVRVSQKKTESEMVVYYVKTKVLKVFNVPYIAQCDALGVLMGGVLHWVMTKHSDSKKLVVGFGLETDELRELPLPDFNRNCNIQVGSFGKFLCMTANYGEKGIDFWVMKEYGVKESWTNIFSFSVGIEGIGFVRPLGLTENDCLVVMELDKGRLVCYDRNNKDIQHFMWKSRHESVVCARSITSPPSVKNGQLGEKNRCIEKEKKIISEKKGDFLSKYFKLKL